MKGKKIFTKSEIDKIKRLVAEKNQATPDKQKGIRQKIRNLEFYYSAFNSPRSGYTVAGITELIRGGQIKVSDVAYKPSSSLTPISVKRPKQDKQTLNKNSSIDLSRILDSFKLNRFDPQVDSEAKVADSPGNYIICLQSNSNLPSVAVNPVLISFDGLKVIYTGIAGGSLRTRDYRQHFKGNNAGRSTLRKSIGVLFGYRQVPRDKNLNSRKTKFKDKDELELTSWMCSNLTMYFLPTANFKRIEIELINKFNPPLNLKDNHNSINADFRRLLSSLRTSGNK